MLREAGFYTSPAGTQHAKLQILTVEQLLNGQKLDLPGCRDVRTFNKRAEGEGGVERRAAIWIASPIRSWENSGAAKARQGLM